MINVRTTINAKATD